jgi:DNA-binding NarL/FixJ family response regulator
LSSIFLWKQVRLRGRGKKSDAMTAASCLAFLQQQPDVILMDINLPDKSDIDLCKEVKTKYPAIHIVGLSSFNQQSFIQKMIDNGASGYVLKNATREKLMETIEMVMQGQQFLSHEAAATVLRNGDSKIPVITRREKEVLLLIAEGLTNNESAKSYLSAPLRSTPTGKTCWLNLKLRIPLP